MLNSWPCKITYNQGWTRDQILPQAIRFILWRFLLP